MIPKRAETSAPTTSSHPSEWKYTVTLKEQDFYLDSESVRYDHSIVTFSYMSIGKAGEVDTEECSINCIKGTHVCGERKTLPRNSIDVKSKTNTDLHWSKIRPDSAWFSFQKSLCKEIAPSESRLSETKTPAPNMERKSKELTRLEPRSSKQSMSSAEKKSKKLERPEPATAKQAISRVEKKEATRPEPPPAKSPMPSVGKKSKELVRLKSTPPEEPGRKVTERGIYFDRYTEVTGMLPGAAEGLIHTGRESRAWYEKSRVSSPLTDRELQAINDTLARTELQDACSIANSILPDKPEKTITLGDLKEKGFIPSEGIKLRIDNGTKESLRISAKHNKGTKLYIADSNCHIREEIQH